MLMPHSLQQGSLRAKLPSPSAPDRRSAAERSEVRRKAVGFQFQPERLSMQSSPSQCPHPKSSFPFRPHPATKFPEYPGQRYCGEYPGRLRGGDGEGKEEGKRQNEGALGEVVRNRGWKAPRSGGQASGVQNESDEWKSLTNSPTQILA